MSCRQQKCDQQCEHSDALAHSMERNRKMRMQQDPRRVTEERNANESGKDHRKKPTESAH